MPLTSKVYIVSGIALYLILLFYWHLPLSLFNALILLNFAAFSIAIYHSLYLKENQCTGKRLAYTVIFFSLVFVSLFMLLSYYYTGNTFIFSEIDARVYEELSYKIKDLPKKDIIGYLTIFGNFSYEDWGAPIAMSYFLKIIPQKEFINLIYIILNTISACMLFSIGKSIMRKKYAYTGALAYSIASYCMFFMGSFLKETMMLFLVIACFYFLYKHKTTKRTYNIILGLAISGLVIFFRPAVTFGIWFSYIVYYMFVEKRKILLIFFSVFAVVIIYILFRLIIESYYKYVDFVEYDYLGSTLFDKLIFVLGGLIGPFPHLLQTADVEYTYKPLFGSGLMYKLFFFYAFWKGAIYSIRKKSFDALPLVAFVILESIELIVVMDSLELRKALPHFPLFIMVAFWYLDQYDSKQRIRLKKTDSTEFIVYMIMAFAIILGWNMLDK